jgi:PKD repeat protein
VVDTQHFNTVAEASQGALKQFFQQAWKSGGDAGQPGVIPEYFDIPPGQAFGPYILQKGTVHIPQNQLDLSMATDVNGVQLKFGLEIQLVIQNPPVPSAGLMNLTADVRSKVAVGKIGGTFQVGVLLDGLDRNNVTATLTSGDPIGPHLVEYITDYIYQLYEADGPSFPQTIQNKDQNFDLYTVDIWVDIFDDPSDPAHAIVVILPPNQITLAIPIHLRIFNIRQNNPQVPLLLDPMGVVATMVIQGNFTDNAGTYTVDFSNPVVTVPNLAPAPAEYGQEGTNYTSNKTDLQQYLFINLDQLVTQQIVNQGTQMAKQFNTPPIKVPTVADIEQAIGDAFYAELKPKGPMGIWTPNPGDLLKVNDVKSQALQDALAIAINPEPGANASALVNFIPKNHDFAVAIDGQTVLVMIDKTIHLPVAKGGFGPTFPNPPMHFTNVNGHDANLTSLATSLQNGAIHIEGDLTVINAIAGSIDVDTSFSEDTGLHWETNPDGSQHIVADPGQPDVDLSLLAWIVSFLIGFITLGLTGGIIGLVVIAIVEAIAQSIGSSLIKNQVTQEVTGIGAWPSNLSQIGTVKATFDRPIDISPGGLVFSGTMSATSTHALTAVVPADAQGPYAVVGGTPLALAAGATHPDASYAWDLGDGGAAATSDVVHTYADDGFYIAELALTVNEPGGALSRSFAGIAVQDSPPIVSLGPDRTVNEGAVVDFTALFTDQQVPDTHRAIWNWDDYQSPDVGVVTEVHDPPQGQGMVRQSHAWGDSGQYTVSLMVIDDGGAVGRATTKVTVLNVPPTVLPLASMFAYTDSVITVQSRFTDPGWLDRHTGTWDFGDGTPPQTAIIDETNLPPMGTGIATASHVYERQGEYTVTCTVTDDDGAVGQASTTIRVVGVQNRQFERGFRERLLGEVANGWEPYTAAPPIILPLPAGTDRDDLAQAPAPVQGVVKGQLFQSEERRTHSGERAQRICGDGPLRAGIMQQIGTNPTWAYHITTWYSLDERLAGLARLGVDPQGATDPDAPTVTWMTGGNTREWTQAAIRLDAETQAITIFLEAVASPKGSVDAVFDDVTLIPIQPFCPSQSSRPQRVCVDFAALERGTQLSSTFQRGGFTFIAGDKLPQRIVSWGPPAGESKLQLHADLDIALPWPADSVTVELAVLGGQPVQIIAVNGQGTVVGQTTSNPHDPTLQTLEIDAPNIAQLHIPAAPREAALNSVCARRGDPATQR